MAITSSSSSNIMALPQNFSTTALSFFHSSPFFHQPFKTLSKPTLLFPQPFYSSYLLRISTPTTSVSLLRYSTHHQHKTLLVETYHHNNTLRCLIDELSRKGSTPVGLLERDGDWTRDLLWPVVVYLLEAGRPLEALQVFNCWKDKEISRITDANYSRIIRLLCERNLLEEALSTFDDMQRYGLDPSFAIYNDMIHGFAREKEFDKSIATLHKMVEAGVLPTPETYHGLIRAYGNYGLYDEMSRCVKKMEAEGCFPNEVTYNLLIGECARGGLLERMERVYRTLLSKKMNLQPHTLVIMLEAYADLGILEKMEKVYRRVVNSKAFIKECLSKKVAMVYIKNCRFTRLEEFGNELAENSGRTDLVWCILLLSSACLLSRKGIESVVREMETANVEFSINFINILGLFYLKIKDFKALGFALSRVGTHSSKPDMVTFGILFDACMIGYSGTRVIEVWKQNGYLERVVEMNTDPLVQAAFGKGYFIKNCEKLYCSLRSKAKEKKMWTYGDLVGLVLGAK